MLTTWLMFGGAPPHLGPFKAMFPSRQQLLSISWHFPPRLPPPTPCPPPSLLRHHHPLFLHVKLGRQVYTLIFKAALFSVKCCVATSNALPDRAFLGFQRGGRIIGGRPQRIWQMCDEFLLELFFFFSFFGAMCVCVCWLGWGWGWGGRLEGKHKGFLCCRPLLPP